MENGPVRKGFLLLMLLSIAAVGAAAEVRISEWYPQGNHYVFMCGDESAGTYNWYFGDGEKLLGISNGNVFHSYRLPGNYTVACEALGDAVQRYELDVTVGYVSPSGDDVFTDPETPPDGNTTIPPNTTTNASVSLSIAPYYPQGKDYVFVCDAQGVTPTGYSWSFGDGEKLLYLSFNDVYHSYTVGGSRTVTCAVHSDGGTLRSSMVIDLGPGGNGTGNETDGNQTGGNQTDVTTCLLNDTFTAPSGYVMYDEIDGEDRQLVWVDPVTRRHFLIEAGADGALRVLGGYDGQHPGPTATQDVWLCVGNACVNPLSQPVTQIESTCPTGGEPRIDLSIAEGFPYDHNALFLCRTSGFDPVNYTFDFGDGTVKTIDHFEGWNSYSASGNYTVSCTATDGNTTMTDSVDVEITTPVAPTALIGGSGNWEFHNETTSIQAWSWGGIPYVWGGMITRETQDGMRATLRCEGYANEPQRAPVWELPAGVTLVSTSEEGRVAVVEAQNPGTYEVSCNVFADQPLQLPIPWSGDGRMFRSGVAFCQYEEPYTCSNHHAAISLDFQRDIAEEATAAIVVDEASADHNYILHCETTGITPTRYVWDFGDGSPVVTRDAVRDYGDHTEGRDDILHTFLHEGTYAVSCVAESANGSTVAEMNITRAPGIEVGTDSWNDPWLLSEVAITPVENRTYSLACDPGGWKADEGTTYQFVINNGPDTETIPDDDGVLEREFAPGSYSIVCQAGNISHIYNYPYYEDDAQMVQPSAYPPNENLVVG